MFCVCPSFYWVLCWTGLQRARDLFEQALEKCPAKKTFGLARRSMSIFDRATQVVVDEDRFGMFAIYIAKSTANYDAANLRTGLLPDRQTAEMRLRFAALQLKLGEIDRARAIYAHASKFCDPRVNSQLWLEWNSFEIETGSEDTLLCIKRSVQAQFNTETSYMTAAAGQGTRKPEEEVEDTMAAAEKQVGGDKVPAFVAAKIAPSQEADGAMSSPRPTVNVDEIHSDEEI
ncbi:hypothetical protein L208DRAFT_1424265 [Tricholoma matsutake]|nr:hypothetical protein L208DRAFT_1424265 [Tricholoma matsutake 945]